MKEIIICSECGILFQKDIAEQKDYRHDDGESHYLCPHCKTEFTEEEWELLHSLDSKHKLGIKI
jgi:uncharacterized C2H2 Zn-finger protein